MGRYGGRMGEIKQMHGCPKTFWESLQLAVLIDQSVAKVDPIYLRIGLQRDPKRMPKPIINLR